MKNTHYDLRPIACRKSERAAADPEAIRSVLLDALDRAGRVLTVECYPGVNVTDILTNAKNVIFLLRNSRKM